MRKLMLEFRRLKQVDCYTKKRREYLCANYKVELMLCTDFLSEKSVLAAKDSRIDNEFFKFSISDDQTSETFFVGSKAGRHFLKLLNIELDYTNSFFIKKRFLDFFTKRDSDNKLKWNKSAKQLLDAINLLILVYIRSELKEPLKSIKSRITTNIESEVSPQDIKAVDTIFKKFLAGKSINEVLRQMKKQHKIKEFKFNELHAKLKNHYGIISCFSK